MQLEAAKRSQEEANRWLALANSRAERLELERQQERSQMDQKLESERQVRIAHVPCSCAAYVPVGTAMWNAIMLALVSCDKARLSGDSASVSP